MIVATSPASLPPPPPHTFNHLATPMCVGVNDQHYDKISNQCKSCFRQALLLLYLTNKSSAKMCKIGGMVKLNTPMINVAIKYL